MHRGGGKGAGKGWSAEDWAAWNASWWGAGGSWGSWSQG